MTDLFGYTPDRVPFVDIRDQRPTTAEKKAILCKILGALLRTAPKAMATADVKFVREWKLHHANAKKTMQNTRSSVNQLESAIKQMSSYDAK